MGCRRLGFSSLGPGAGGGWGGGRLLSVPAGGGGGRGGGGFWPAGWGRRLGRVPIVIEPPEVERLRGGGAFVPAGWGTDEIGRAVLLLAAAEGRTAERVLAAVDELYRKGEMREQQAVLRVLAYLPE